MDYQLIVLLSLIPAGVVCFQFGRATKEYPSEEEMIRLIVAGRIEGRIRKEVEAELSAEINRRTAGSA
jgi:hypothetical protein